MTLDLCPECKLLFREDSPIQIGEVAALTGVSVDTIRFYERRQLLRPADRTAGGFRLYDHEAVERIRFIRHAQEMGLSLKDIAKLIATRGTSHECEKVRDFLQQKVAELDERIQSMQKFRDAIQSELSTCERQLAEVGKTAKCPVLRED